MQAISLIAGVLLVVVSKLNALGVLDVFTVTWGSLIGLFGVLIAIYGAIGLANRDWQWVRRNMKLLVVIVILVIYTLYVPNFVDENLVQQFQLNEKDILSIKFLLIAFGGIAFAAFIPNLLEWFRSTSLFK